MAYRTWQMRRNTAALAAASNPVLAAGEPGFETDTGHFKIGDGTRHWNDLPTFGPGNALEPVGIMWDTASTSPTLTRIDINRDTINTNGAEFDRNPIYAGRWRCVRDRTTGAITYGTNARGDGLTLDGTAGDVLVRKPLFYCKAATDGDYRMWWVSPIAYPGFVAHPAFYQRGGALNPVIYDGAYEAYGYLDGATFKLGSASGKQPVTGAVAYTDLPESGRLTIDDAETYAGNIGAGFGCKNFWNYAADQLLMYIEYASFDIQTKLGKGVCDLASSSGFAGKNTGADSADTNIGTNGTGTGTGANGQTPVVWRGLENPYGNVWEFSIGANAYLDGSVRLAKRDGTGALAATLAAGTYETATGPTPANGYIAGLQDGDLEGLAFLPIAAAGSDATYLCDYWHAPPGNGYILRAGGAWNSARSAGPGCRSADYAPSDSGRGIGARVEYIPGAV